MSIVDEGKGKAKREHAAFSTLVQWLQGRMTCFTDKKGLYSVKYCLS